MINEEYCIYRKRWNESAKRSFDWHLRKFYNITIGQYDQILSCQEGRCAICQEPAKGKLHVDHCHAGSYVRGLLCPDCNRGLGGFRDKAEYCEAASEYLRVNGK